MKNVIKAPSPQSIIVPAVMMLTTMITQADEPDKESFAPEGKTYVFECSAGNDFVVDISSKGTWLFRDQQTLALEAPRGLVAYTAPGIELLIFGDDATLREVGQTTQFCHNNHKRAIWEHAKLNGVDFRAIGNEPGWSLEFIEGNRIVLKTDYNATRVERPLPEAKTDTIGRKTRWDADGLIIEVSSESCQDSMSGEIYESTVTVHVNNQALHGCGKALH